MCVQYMCRNYKLWYNSALSQHSQQTDSRKRNEQQHLISMTIECFGRCTACVKSKRSSRYCWLIGHIPLALSKEFVSSYSQTAHNHQGTGVTCCSSAKREIKLSTFHNAAPNTNVHVLLLLQWKPPTQLLDCTCRTTHYRIVKGF